MSLTWRRALSMALRELVPFKATARRLKRRLLPYSDNPANSHWCITQGLEMIAALREAGFDPRGARLLEFGTGWLPLIPLLFHLAGVREMVLTDVERLMDTETIALAKRRVLERGDEVARALGIEKDELAGRLTRFQFEYRVPWLPETTSAELVDLVLSRAVFEHVPIDELRTFLAAFFRILRPGGFACHLIDNSDHWQHGVPAASRVGFLAFEEHSWLWRLAQLNRQAWQNRLRHSDYRSLFRATGFDVVLERGEPDARALADLATLPLASRFACYTPEDLAVLTSVFVMRKPQKAINVFAGAGTA
ncbi:MAG: class I SAM-dependent methyltransferase [Acetobacteraceae bacterium]|nr:class I SAM-dependent methyltransferase [Acetobacteraceae bacterium]